MRKTKTTKKSDASVSDNTPKLTDESREDAVDEISTDMIDISDPEKGEACDPSVIEDEMLDAPDSVDLDEELKVICGIDDHG